MQEAAQQQLADPRTHGEQLLELVQLGLAAGPFDVFDEDFPTIQSLLREEQENLEVLQNQCAQPLATLLSLVGFPLRATRTLNGRCRWSTS